MILGEGFLPEVVLIELGREAFRFHACLGLEVAARRRAIGIAYETLAALAVEAPRNALEVLTGRTTTLVRLRVALAQTTLLHAAVGAVEYLGADPG